jgi:hypothetical protein
MAVHGSAPFVHVEDSNGNPYVAALLYVYDATTTTKKAIYSDTGLSVTLTNPLVSDASGNFSRFYMAAGTYKLRAETAAGVLIWQFDNIDTLLGSGSGALPVASGGTGATTAASARTNLSAAAQTDVDDLAADIAALSASLQNLVSVPQGYLTLTSGTAIITGDVLAATSVYYTPYIGNQIPIYDGTQFNLSTFSELTLTLNSNHTASNIYDVFAWLESGVVTLGTGPAWNTATAGAGARGSGAGTTELERKNGLWTNKNSMTTRNGATTYTVAANKGTYVGSIFMDGTNGQITCHRAYGQSRKFGVWNAYNRVPIIMLGGDSTATWVYGTNTVRPSNNSSSNKITAFQGLQEEAITVVFKQVITQAANISNTQIGIGINSTTVMSGFVGDFVPLVGNRLIPVAEVDVPAGILGISAYQMLENSPGSSATTTFNGAETSMKMTVSYRG